jgi:hypothetical protein
MSNKANLMVMSLKMRALERRVAQLESSRPNIPSYWTTTYEERIVSSTQADWIVDTLSFEHEEGDTSKAWSKSHKLWIAKLLVSASEAYWLNVEENADKAARRHTI